MNTPTTQDGVHAPASNNGFGGGPSQPQDGYGGNSYQAMDTEYGGSPSQPQMGVGANMARAQSNRNESVTNEWVMEQHRAQQVINAQLMEGLQRLLSKQVETGGAPASTETPETVVRGVSGALRKPKHSLPKPADFDGEDRSKYPTFRGSLRAKLRIDRLAIGGEDELVWYAHSCLTGRAAARLYPWIDSHEERLIPLRISDYLDELDLAFKDTQAAQTALDWINRAKQGSTPFREFLHEFEENLMKAGGWEFTDVVRIGYLKGAISPKIKEALVGYTTPTSYVDYVSKLRSTSDNIEELKNMDRFRQRYRAQVPLRDTAVEDKMDWELSPRTSSGQPPKRIPAKWVTQEVLNKRKRDGACLRCGHDTHFISGCKFGPAQRPNSSRPSERKSTASSNRKKTTKTTIEEASDTESSQSSEDSGKE